MTPSRPDAGHGPETVPALKAAPLAAIRWPAPPAARPRPAVRRVLPVVAGMLIASALVRAVLGAGAVLADEGADGSAIFAGPVGIEAEGTPEVLAALAAREERLAAREAQVAARLAELALAQDELEAQVATLQAAEASLSATLALAETAATEDLARLAAVYQAMKPKDAADLFAAMDPGFSAGFLGLMAAESAAGIMTNLEPEAAYAISAVLAGRNALAPTE